MSKGYQNSGDPEISIDSDIWTQLGRVGGFSLMERGGGYLRPWKEGEDTINSQPWLE